MLTHIYIYIYIFLFFAFFLVKLVEQFMTEDVQVGGDADQKLQSQLYIGKSTCVILLSQAVQQLIVTIHAG